MAWEIEANSYDLGGFDIWESDSSVDNITVFKTFTEAKNKAIKETMIEIRGWQAEAKRLRELRTWDCKK